MPTRSRLFLAVLLAATAAPASASAAGLIAAYDRYVPGQGFEIGLVNVSNNTPLTLPAGVNTTADELHPTLSHNGRFIWFVRTQLQPTLTGDVPIPEDRTLMRLNRNTGAVTAFTQDGDAGYGAMYTDFGQPTLAFGTRPRPNPTNSSNPLVGISRNINLTTGDFGTNGLTPAAGPFSNDPVIETTQLAAELDNTGIFRRTWLSRASFDTNGRLLAANIGIFPRTGTAIGGQGVASHAAPRPGDGFVAYQSGVGTAAKILTINPPSTASTPAPVPINSGFFDGIPAWSPDLGKHLGFITVPGASRVLRAYDTTPGIQSVVLPEVDLGASAPTAQLRSYHEQFGGLSLALDSSVTIPNISCSACVSRTNQTTALQPTVSSTLTGQAIGIFVARVTGTRTLFGRRVPAIKPVGRVPLGATRKGRNSFNWNGRVEGKKLKKGTYLLTFRALQDDEVVATSGSVRFKVDGRGRPKGFRRL